jgi:ADP-ribose pyrophosphatase YjhB (NUDIX family)
MTETHRNPLVTVDIIIEMCGEPSGPSAAENCGIILIQRKNPPHGWALPGGFVDYGESLETAAVREAREETSLEVTLLEQFYAYSAPERDPRHHTVTTVFIARATGIPRARDDAGDLDIFRENELPAEIAFDHARIIRDYYAYRSAGQRPKIRMPGSSSG